MALFTSNGISVITICGTPFTSSTVYLLFTMILPRPVWYASFDMEVTGDFENGSYGVYEKLSSFTIKTEDGQTRTVTTNIEDATVNENGTITVPVELTAPDPTLLEEFTGELKLNTVLHEMIPFAA